MSEKSKKPIFKKWWFWAICVVVVIGVVGLIAGRNDEDALTSSTTESESLAESTIATVDSSVPEFIWAESEVTNETVDTVLDAKRHSLSRQPIEIHVVYSDTSQKDIQITVDIDGLGGDLAMRGLFKCLNQYAEILFENPNVAQVMVRGQIILTDTNGNKTENDATNVVWTRETASSINHDSYDDIAMGSQYPTCFETADEYFIHQAIFQKMSEAGDIPASKSVE